MIYVQFEAVRSVCVKSSECRAGTPGPASQYSYDISYDT